MAKYSRVTIVDGKRFRYNYGTGEIEWIYKDESMDVVIDSIGLGRSNWEDKETRKEYLNEYAYQLECEANELLRMEFGGCYR